MGAGDLSAALWQERRQLEVLLFRLETQQLHVEAGNLRWLGFTAAEVADVLDRLRFEALARSVESAGVAVEWGLPPETSLPGLIGVAPPGPWAEILSEHRTGLQDLLGRLGNAVRAGRNSLEAVRLTVAAGAPPAGTFSELDQLTLTGTVEHALAVIGQTGQPHLAEYLGNSPG
ncbi:flagellar protein FlgN [Arthrobacter oryzae]|uniref:Flagellar protein FlgN n=1 Tax=Arthrobacter oryzae TaxID=409290 RepID=A0A3N0CE74_9MICC|nr:flagellar protein FlgN [Arthrobacter oryzae]RNL61541.1 flagellar protein FlgN [Arthrobacter oryzae]